MHSIVHFSHFVFKCRKHNYFCCDFLLGLLILNLRGKHFSPKNHFLQIPVKIHLSRSKFIIEFEFDHYKMTKQIFSEQFPFKQEWVIHIGIKYPEYIFKFCPISLCPSRFSMINTQIQITLHRTRFNLPYSL